MEGAHLKKIIVLDGDPDHDQELGRLLLDQALANRQVRALFEEMLADSRLSDRDRFGGAFMLGAIAAVNAMREGHLKTFPKG